MTVLVLAEGFNEGPDADAVAEAIARGLSADGRLRCDPCPIERNEYTDPIEREQRTNAGGGGLARAGFRRARPSALLDAHDFDRRMRAARAIVIATPRLDDRALAGSLVFEAATRARQAGVPAYAITAENALDPFEARIVDLQVILRASTPRALSAAARELATVV